MIEISQEHLARISSDLGADIQPFPLDGEFHHFKADHKTKKPLWCKGKVWQFSGNSYYIVQYGDFRGQKKFQVASYELKDQTKAFIKTHTDEVKKLEEANRLLREKKRADGIAKYKPRFYQCSATSKLSEYLERKKITHNFSARVDYRNTLLVPVEGVDEDNNISFEGVQMIWRDATTFKWVKTFNEGVMMRGCFTRITEFDIKKTEIVYLCEGFATACSVFMATTTPTICAFNEGNLTPVIEKLKELNADIKIILCADDDFQTVINGKQVNVGINAALAAQRKFQNVTYRKPLFKVRTAETDFNDLHLLEGIDVVREQLKINLAEFTEIVLLGHVDHEEFFYLSTQSKAIIRLRGHQHDSKYLKTIATEKYWAEKYGWKKDKDGNQFPNWVKISDTLLERQREIGPFDIKKMRGVGVWDDAGRVFVNDGNGVYNRERDRVMSNIDPHLGTKNFYRAEAGAPINFDDELSDEESLQIIKAFQLLRFSSQYDYFYVCGFIAIANCFAALDWRPHLWISGPAGSGKSWTLKQIEKLVHYNLFVVGSTVSGIKQKIGCDARTVIYDEAEASPMVDAVVELARQCSTKSSAQILRGTLTGEAIGHDANACFVMGSIQPPLMRKADESRFFLMEMETLHDQSKEEYEAIYEAFKLIENFGKRLMVRVAKNLPMLKANIELAKVMLRAKGINSRESDQLSAIVAGFVMLNTKGLLTQSFFDQIWSTVKLDSGDYMQRNNEDTTGEDAYNALMHLVIDHHAALNVKEAVKNAVENAKAHPMLANYGLEVRGQKLFVAANWPELDTVMARKGLPNFRALIRRSEFAVEKTASLRVNLSPGKTMRGMLLKV